MVTNPLSPSTVSMFNASCAIAGPQSRGDPISSGNGGTVGRDTAYVGRTPSAARPAPRNTRVPRSVRIGQATNRRPTLDGGVCAVEMGFELQGSRSIFKPFDILRHRSKRIR